MATGSRRAGSGVAAVAGADENRSRPALVLATSRAASTNAATTTRVTTTAAPGRRRRVGGRVPVPGARGVPGSTTGSTGVGCAPTIGEPRRPSSVVEVMMVASPHWSRRVACRAVRMSSLEGNRSPGSAGEGAHDDRIEIGGHPGDQVAGRRRRPLEAGERQGGRALGPERRLAAQRLVEHDAEGVEVGAGVDRSHPRPARGRGTSPCRASGSCWVRSGSSRTLAIPKSATSTRPSSRQQDVGRLDVSVDEPGSVGQRRARRPPRRRCATASTGSRRPRSSRYCPQGPAPRPAP